MYLVQAQWEAAICGYPWGTVCALVGNEGLLWHDYELDQDFIEASAPQLFDFMSKVNSDTPPDTEHRDLRTYKKLQGGPYEQTINGETEAMLDELWQKRARASEAVKEWTKYRDEFEIAIRKAFPKGTSALLGKEHTYRLSEKKKQLSRKESS